MFQRHIALPLLLAGVLAAAPALAQTPSLSSPTMPAMPAAATNADGTKRDARIEHRIAELHTKLKITAAQEKPFADFANVMRSNATDMDDAVAKRVAILKTGNAVEQMKAYSDMAQTHAQNMQKLVPAFTTLYEALSPDQKKLADQSFRDFANKSRDARS